MITNLRDITSLNNLGKKGQIATLLVLMMVAVLIFILVTVNIGRVSVEATRLANAADSSALLLGSQLATKARYLYESLGNTTEKCKKGGWAVLFFAFIGLSFGGLIGAAIGGGLGAAYQGTGVVEGAVEGFTIGVTIVAAVVVGYLTYGVGTAVIAGLLAAGGKVYSTAVDQRMTAASFSATARQLSNLTEYDQYRESAFFKALSQSIDDPNEIQDIYDSDEDGDTEELVPYFQYWWERRVDALERIVPQLKSLTENFTGGPLTDLRDSNEAQYTETCTTTYDSDGEPILTCVQGALSRQEAEGTDGAVVELARTLENFGYNVPFWRPGTPAPYDPDCDECSPDEAYDEVDYVTSELQRFVAFAEEIKQQNIDQLTTTWQTWVNLSYDPETIWTPTNVQVNADWYDVFTNETIPILEGWKTEIIQIRDSLPQARYGYWDDDDSDVCVPSYGVNGECVSNPPSRDGTFATIDENLDDEFAAAIAAVDSLINDIESFRSATYAFYTNMWDAYAQLDTEYGGLNPATYTWTDSRGEHSISAEAGPYRLARIETWKDSSGFLGMKKKVCLVLKDYSDDGSRTWLKVTRQDPANKELGILGKWNPTASADEDSFSITRRSRSAYSYGYVRISGR